MPITELNKYINRKGRFNAYNNSCIPQLGICRVTIGHKKVELPYTFFIVPGYGPLLLGVPDREIRKAE